MRGARGDGPQDVDTDVARYRYFCKVSRYAGFSFKADLCFDPCPVHTALRATVVLTGPRSQTPS